MTTTSTTASSTSAALALGVGSGIDTKSLVANLVSAQYDTKRAQLSTRKEALTTQISAAGTLKSSLADFSSALAMLASGGTLATQPSSSNTSILGVAALSGAKLGSLSAQVEVRQLAAAQSTATEEVADRTASVGTGSLTFTFGTATVAGGAMTAFTAGPAQPVTIAITSASSSLDGIAAAINAAKAGVTATVLSDADGARLTLKSATGASQAFTLTATEDAGAPGLAALDVGVGATGTTVGTAAQDAIVAVDGIAFHRASNTISNLITGVRLTLNAASVGTKVTVGSTPPAEALSQAVNNFVETYNQLHAVAKADADPVNGSLKSAAAVQTVLRSMSDLTLAKLVPASSDGSTPRTLAEIGVGTNRDGSLTVDTAKLASALGKWPDTIEAMFAPATGTAATDNGLSAALAAITTTASSTQYGLAAIVTRLTEDQSDLADQIAAVEDQATNMTTRLTQQFASMDAKVAAYKSTQSFLQAQIDAWNSKDN